MAAEPKPLEGAAYLRLVVLGAVLGVPAALIAAGFLALVHQLEDVLWDDLPDALGYSSAPWFLILGIPLAGAVVVILARRFLPGDGGHEPLNGISMEPVALAAGPGVALAAIGTLSFGAVLGPEGPLIALGSVVGVATARLVKLGQRENAVLATAGSFSAISALFGGPLPAGVLLIEAGVGLGAALIPVMLPGLVAAACGYVVFLGLGDWAGLESTKLIVPDLPVYDGTSVPDLLLAIAVGIGTGVLVIGARKLGQRVHALRGRGVGMPALLIAGALAVGCLTLIADALGGDSPEVLFSGQAALPDVLVEGSAGVLIAIMLAKVIAYGICLGCGFRGGPVFPAIFTGVALATLAVVLFDTSPTLAVAIGTAAGMAAATRLLISSLVIAALLVGSNGFDAISAAVLAAATAWLVGHVLDPPPDPAPPPAPA